MAVLEQRFDTLEEKLDNLLKILDCLPQTYATKVELVEVVSKFKPYTMAMNMVAGAFLLAIVGGVIRLISQHGVL